jgi:hypothetical protein
MEALSEHVDQEAADELVRADALACRPEEVEAPRRLAARLRRGFGLRQLGRDLGLEALVARQAEHVIDPVLLAPRHQGLTGKARVGPQQDAHARPARPDLGDDARNLLDSPGAAVVGPAEMYHLRTLKRLRPAESPSHGPAALSAELL